MKNQDKTKGRTCRRKLEYIQRIIEHIAKDHPYTYYLCQSFLCPICYNAKGKFRNPTVHRAGGRNAGRSVALHAFRAHLKGQHASEFPDDDKEARATREDLVQYFEQVLDGLEEDLQERDEN